MIGVKDLDDHTEFVEFDPTRRYGRYNEVLGKGASKKVYRAFDEYEGIEVAWNQVKLTDFLQSPQDLERLYCEIHLLKTLKHKNIIKFYTSWVDTNKRKINFVTELFTSGTLRQYREKHKRVHIRAVKNWCRQILRGLLYLHSNDPPIIHRDLKCDNIFINGNQGIVKIGDLGLAAILRKSHADHCVGTPEFMAPEVYKEEYNELVDIYSFGMCVLEMVTFEYPYSECTHPAQIYKKVISGEKPDALYKVEDPEVRRFVEKCLATASQRLSARELLEDPFLRIDDNGSGSWEGDITRMCQILRTPSYDLLHNIGALILDGNVKNEISMEKGWDFDDPEASNVHHHPSNNGLYHSNGSLVVNCFDDGPLHQMNKESGSDYEEPDPDTLGINLFNGHEDEPVNNMDITIRGKRMEDGGIFLRLRIADNEGRVRNIYFPFDVENDTPLSVAIEMVGELDIIDYDVSRIADMIDGEVSLLVRNQELGQGLDELPSFSTNTFSPNCLSEASSSGSLLNYVSLENQGFIYQQSGHHHEINYAAMVGVSTAKVEEYMNIEEPSSDQNRLEALELSSQAAREGYFDDGTLRLTQSVINNIEIQSNLSDYYKSKTHQEVRWPDSEDQTEQRDDIINRLGERRPLSLPQAIGNGNSRLENGVMGLSNGVSVQESSKAFMKSLNFGKKFSFSLPPRRNLLQTAKSFGDTDNYRYCYVNHQDLELRGHTKTNGSSEKSFCADVHLPSPISRTKSLPVKSVIQNV